MALQRVLVVDEERSARQALGELLADEGYAVETARDASDALSKAAEFLPDLVLTDVMLLGMPGDMLARRLHETTPELPVIAMSTREFSLRSRGDGFCDRLAKPLQLSQVLGAIRRALDVPAR
jgi:DNA-binding response OmpR family regulator